MEIYFLGTSSGTPTKSRNVSALALIESQGSRWYLIDCGEATQHQLLHTHLSVNNLEAIFITHIHGDHCYGLPGLLASAGMNGRTKPLKIIAPKRIQAWFEATQIHTDLFLPFKVEFIAVENMVGLALGQFKVSMVELSHRVPSYGFAFTEVKVDASLDTDKLIASGLPQGALWGQLKSGKDVEYQGKLYPSHDFIKPANQPRKVIICGDNDYPDLLKDISQDCHLLVHEATYSADMAQKAAEVGHSYAALVACFAQKMGIANLLLTHFSARYQAGDDKSLESLKEEAKAQYSGCLYLAEDFQRYQLDKTGQLTLLQKEL